MQPTFRRARSSGEVGFFEAFFNAEEEEGSSGVLMTRNDARDADSTPETADPAATVEVS